MHEKRKEKKKFKNILVSYCFKKLKLVDKPLFVLS